MEYYDQIRIIYGVCECLCLCLKKRADEVYKSKREDASAGAYKHKTTNKY